MSIAINSPTGKLRWREALTVFKEEYNHPYAITKDHHGVEKHYILEQEFRTQYADESPELEWHPVEISQD